jgi:hypothetical protein
VKVLASLVALIVAAGCLAGLAGCGSNTGALKVSTPEQTARTVLDLAIAGKLAQASEHFTEQGMARLLVTALAGEKVVRVGAPAYGDARSAKVDLYTGTHSLPSVMMTLVQSGGSWKITQVIPE